MGLCINKNPCWLALAPHLILLLTLKPENCAGIDWLPSHPETYFTPPQVLLHRGYPSETHHVTTDDGYILELHRIPPKKKDSRVVFLQHGLIEASGTWLVNPANRSLACLLWDRGYDVWMGNARGNRYSRAHIRLDPKGAEFWDFSWDEYGQYDIPASLNFVLNQTGQSKLNYVGHSMGCAMFFVAMIRHPELNAKIDLMVGLAPQAAFRHVRNWLSPLKHFYQISQFVLNLIGTRAYVDSEGLPRELMRLACEQTYSAARVCRLFLNSIAGWDLSNVPLELIPVALSNVAMGTSVKTFSQLSQHHIAGTEVFQAYDYGRARNLKRYGTPRPFQYDLTKVTAPVYVFWGQKDDIVAPADVLWLLKKMSNLQGSTGIDGYNHVDFIWGTDVKERCYDKLTTLLPAA